MNTSSIFDTNRQHLDNWNKKRHYDKQKLLLTVGSLIFIVSNHLPTHYRKIYLIFQSAVTYTIINNVT